MTMPDPYGATCPRCGVLIRDLARHNQWHNHLKQLTPPETQDNHTHRCEHNINGTWCERFADEHDGDD